MVEENHNWKWWVGRDEETFHTECDNREEAVHIASHEQEGGWIGEAVKADNVKLSGYFTADCFIEDANERAYDMCDELGDHILFDIAPDQESELQDMVRAAIDAWQEKHGLKFVPWRFARQRNLEWIDAAEDD